MPRRKISQREAREAIKQRDALRLYVDGELAAPCALDRHCIAVIGVVRPSEYALGVLDGVKKGRRAVVVARREDNGCLTILGYRLPDGVKL